MDLNIKDAFQRAKQDINFLKDNILDLHKELNEIQTSLLLIMKELGELKEIRQTDRQTDTSTHNSTDKLYNTTDKYSNTTDNTLKNPITTDILPFKPLKQLNMVSSIGNNGVSTDRQTDRQTDTSTHNLRLKTTKSNTISNTTNSEITVDKTLQTTLNSHSSLIFQLDDFKKNLRNKIKRLTNQEMLVYSAIYQFELQGELIDYAFLSSSLNLSESSIRDYIQRISSKGLPLDKEKINNKKILLHIPKDFQKLASLETLMTLRNI